MGCYGRLITRHRAVVRGEGEEERKRVNDLVQEDGMEMEMDMGMEWDMCIGSGGLFLGRSGDEIDGAGAVRCFGS